MGRLNGEIVTRDVPEMWASAERLVDLAPSLDALRAHRLQWLAASLWRSRGTPVPSALRPELTRGAVMAMAAPELLARACDAYSGPLMLMKGPEVAARYPEPSARYFRDLDLLASDPLGAQRALVAAGFVELDDGNDWKVAHHLAPLGWPGLPLIIEIHRIPKLPAWLNPPSAAELLATAVPSSAGIGGLLAPSPAVHALLLAGHAWSHRPLGRLGDLVDVAATLGECDPEQVAELARRWGWEGTWGTTRAAVDALFWGGPPSLPLRTWARYLAQARDLSMLEWGVLRVAGPASVAPARRLPRIYGSALARATRPREGETWAEKLVRNGQALRHALAPKVQHDAKTSNNPSAR